MSKLWRVVRSRVRGERGRPRLSLGEEGGAFRTPEYDVVPLEPLDLLLEEPVFEDAEPAEYDLVTGRLNPQSIGPRNRQVFLRKNRRQNAQAEEGDSQDRRLGEFRPCGVCGETAAFGRTSVEDHQTKGDQPFQALIANKSKSSLPGMHPRRASRRCAGARSLFSQTRQTAARLAPNLQTYSTRDALRPLIVVGFSTLQRSVLLGASLSLEDLYFAVLAAAELLGVRLRPELKLGESFHAEELVTEAIRAGVLARDTDLLQLYIRIKNERPPESLLRGITNTLVDRYYGLESLALLRSSSGPRTHLNWSRFPISSDLAARRRRSRSRGHGFASGTVQVSG